MGVLTVGGSCVVLFPRQPFRRSPHFLPPPTLPPETVKMPGDPTGAETVGGSSRARGASQLRPLSEFLSVAACERTVSGVVFSKHVELTRGLQHTPQPV